MSFDFEAKGKDVQYKKHSTQINLYDCCSEKDFNFLFLQRNIKEDAIYREFPQIEEEAMLGIGFNLVDNPKEEYGYESVPHISVLYGISDENSYFLLRDKLKDFSPFTFKIGNVSSFRRDDKEFDVLMIQIDSPKLVELHNFIKENCKNTYSFPEYKPHMTLAYVKKGKCKELEGPCAWTGSEYTCGFFKFSHKDGYYLDVPLR